MGGACQLRRKIIIITLKKITAMAKVNLFTIPEKDEAADASKRLKNGSNPLEDLNTEDPYTKYKKNISANSISWKYEKNTSRTNNGI